MNQSVINSLAIVTVVLLLIFSAFLLTLKRRNISHLLLSLFLFSNAVYIIDFILPVIGKTFDIDFSSYYGVGFSFGFLFAPLLYLYTHSITRKHYSFNKKEILHFLLFAFIFVDETFHLRVPTNIVYPLLHVQIFLYMFLIGGLDI